MTPCAAKRNTTPFLFPCRLPRHPTADCRVFVRYGLSAWNIKSRWDQVRSPASGGASLRFSTLLGAGGVLRQADHTAQALFRV